MEPKNPRPGEVEGFGVHRADASQAYIAASAATQFSTASEEIAPCIHVGHLRGMSLSEAHSVLAGIGYRTDWTIDELRAAVPVDMRQLVAIALRVVAASEMAEANGLEGGA